MTPPKGSDGSGGEIGRPSSTDGKGGGNATADASSGQDAGGASRDDADGAVRDRDATQMPPADGAIDGAVAGPCGPGTLKQGNSTQAISFGGGMRSYLLHVPRQYDGKTRLPVVIDLHGKGGTGQAQMGTSGWLAKSDAAGILMIYPNGLYNAWNGGPPGCPIAMCCCEPPEGQNVDDTGFLRALLAKTAQDGCIDLKRVYATGLSNGGFMSHWLGCDAADVFAAVGPVSGANIMDCKPSRPITIVEYRGLQDNAVRYNGGPLILGPATYNLPSATGDFNKWSDLDGCTDMPMPMHSICQVRSKCMSGAEVILCSPDAGHVLYGGAAQQMAAVPDVQWEIFQRHMLP